MLSLFWCSNCLVLAIGGLFKLAPMSFGNITHRLHPHFLPHHIPGSSCTFLAPAPDTSPRNPDSFVLVENDIWKRRQGPFSFETSPIRLNKRIHVGKPSDPFSVFTIRDLMIHSLEICSFLGFLGDIF